MNYPRPKIPRSWELGGKPPNSPGSRDQGMVLCSMKSDQEGLLQYRQIGDQQIDRQREQRHSQHDVPDAACLGGAVVSCLDIGRKA